MDEFEYLRHERRSFCCSNKLWNELLHQTDNCMSISIYIRQAIVERMIREEPEKEAYFRDLLQNEIK